MTALPHDLRLLSPPGAAARTANAPPAFDASSLTDAQRSALAARINAVEDWLAYRDAHASSGHTVDALLAAHLSSLSGHVPSSRTLRRWVSQYTRFGAVGLLDTRGRPSSPCDSESMSPDAWIEFTHLYLHASRRTVRVCYDITAGLARQNGWAWPSYRSVLLRVQSDLPDFHADYFRLGPTRWGRKYQARMQRDIEAWRSNEMWIGDHHELDLLVLHQGRPIRPWLTAWLDGRSRYIVGWTLAPSPSSDTIIAAFRRGVLEHGAPNALLMDNGKDYRASGFAGGRKYRVEIDEAHVGGLLAQLGVRAHWTQTYSPDSKGAIESWFRTVCDRFTKGLFGDVWVGNKPDARPEHLHADLRAGNIDVPQLADVAALLGQWITEVYHRQAHSGAGMDGRSPADVFADDPIARRTATAEVLDLLLMRTAIVAVTRNGLRVNGVQYGQSIHVLRTRIGSQVMVRIDPLDASRVIVCELDGRKICDAYQDGLVGTTQDDVREGLRRQRAVRKLAAAALPALRESRLRTRDHVLRAMADRVQGSIGVPPVQSATGTNDARPIALLPGAAALAQSANSDASDGGAWLRHDARPDSEKSGRAPTEDSCNRLAWLRGTSSDA